MRDNMLRQGWACFAAIRTKGQGARSVVFIRYRAVTPAVFRSVSVWQHTMIVQYKELLEANVAVLQSTPVCLLCHDAPVRPILRRAIHGVERIAKLRSTKGISKQKLTLPFAKSARVGWSFRSFCGKADM